MRCFLAIELTEATIVTLESAGSTIRALDPAWAGEKWVAPRVMHVTVKFLGELDVNTVERVVSALTSATRSASTVRADRSHGRACGSETRTGIDALGGASRIPTGRLQRPGTIGRQHRRWTCGLEPDIRPFAPHVTHRSREATPCRERRRLSEANEQFGSSQLEPMSVLSRYALLKHTDPSGTDSRATRPVRASGRKRGGRWTKPSAAAETR